MPSDSYVNVQHRRHLDNRSAPTRIEDLLRTLLVLDPQLDIVLEKEKLLRQVALLRDRLADRTHRPQRQNLVQIPQHQVKDLLRVSEPDRVSAPLHVGSLEKLD